jgi:hypothetical protein
VSFEIITEIKEILKTVKDDFKFISWNTSEEITGYPACVADIILKEYEKQVSVGQFYNAILRLGIYIIVDYDTKDDKFEKLINKALAKMVKINKYNDVSINNISVGHFEIAERKTKAFFTEIKFEKKEYQE